MNPKEKPPQFAFEPKNVAQVAYSEIHGRKGDMLRKWKVTDDAREQIKLLQKAGITNDGILFELTTPSKRMRENTHRETTIIGNRTYVIAELVKNNDPLLKNINSPTLRKALGFAIINDITTHRMSAAAHLIEGRNVEHAQDINEIALLDKLYNKLFEVVNNQDPSIRAS